MQFELICEICDVPATTCPDVPNKAGNKLNLMNIVIDLLLKAFLLNDREIHFMTKYNN